MFDQKIKLLHLLNKNGDASEIVSFLYASLPSPDILETYSYEDSIAAMRDIGIFIGILKRFGVEPVQAIPELEYVLLVLMVKTNLPPRDTIMHYSFWNPDGLRMRTYSEWPDEKELIISVKIAIEDLIESIVNLAELNEIDTNDPLFVGKCAETRSKLESMVKGIVHSKRNVNPAIFYNELRPYFDPIVVDYNKTYFGPGAVEMPMFVFDHLLWSCDLVDQTFTNFKEGYLPYNLPFIRDTFKSFNDKPSLVTRVLKALTNKPMPANYRAAKAVLDLCVVLKSFRMPHKRVAEAAYASAGENDKRHDVGSGGYSTDVLQHIINIQNQRIHELQGKIVQLDSVEVGSGGQ
ncbi:MAG: monodechloroaminopyrrolnitrin synthase PrnB family protein [Flammeovirgaceae bacterium]